MLNLDCANDISEKEEDEEMLKCAVHGCIRECPYKCKDFLNTKQMFEQETNKVPWEVEDGN